MFLLKRASFDATSISAATILLPSLIIIAVSSAETGGNWNPDIPYPPAGPHIAAVFSSDTAELLYAEQMVPTAGDGEFVYYSVLNFYIGSRGAYAGIQHATGTTINPEGVPLVYCNKFSVWDKKPDEDETHPPEARLEYAYPGLQWGKFGHEGTGLQTGHPMPWSRDTWYATAIRRWYKPNETVTYLGMFMYDYGTKNWTHYATISVPETDVLFTSKDSEGFLERYAGDPVGYYGLYGHYFKMHANGVWEKPSYYRVSADGPPNLWDAEVVGKDAVKVIAGGVFDNDKEAKNLTLDNDEERPRITMIRPIVQNFDAKVITSSTPFILDVTWVVDETAPPQFSYELRVFDDELVVVAEKSDTTPHSRGFRFDLPEKKTVSKGWIELKIVSIFNDVSDVTRISWSGP